MKKQDLIVVVEDSWQRLDAAVNGLDEAEMAQPGVVEQWSIKDLLGHVTAWEQRALQFLEPRRGEEPLPSDVPSTDEFNAQEASKRNSWSLAQVRDEAHAARRRLRALLDGVSSAEWAAPITIGGREQPCSEWIEGALNGGDGPGTHATEHAAQIQAWRAARAAGNAP